MITSRVTAPPWQSPGSSPWGCKLDDGNSRGGAVGVSPQTIKAEGANVSCYYALRQDTGSASAKHNIAMAVKHWARLWIKWMSCVIGWLLLPRGNVFMGFDSKAGVSNSFWYLVLNHGIIFFVFLNLFYVLYSCSLWTLLTVLKVSKQCHHLICIIGYLHLMAT